MRNWLWKVIVGADDCAIRFLMKALISRLEIALDEAGDARFLKSPRELDFDCILICSEEAKFSLVFDIRGSDLAWGMSADFDEWKLDSLEELH